MDVCFMLYIYTHIYNFFISFGSIHFTLHILFSFGCLQFRVCAVSLWSCMLSCAIVCCSDSHIAIGKYVCFGVGVCSTQTYYVYSFLRPYPAMPFACPLTPVVVPLYPPIDLYANHFWMDVCPVCVYLHKSLWMNVLYHMENAGENTDNDVTITSNTCRVHWTENERLSERDNYHGEKNIGHDIHCQCISSFIHIIACNMKDRSIQCHMAIVFAMHMIYVQCVCNIRQKHWSSG